MKKKMMMGLSLICMICSLFVNNIQSVEAETDNVFENSDLLMEEANLHTPTMVEAYEYYQSIYKELVLKDLAKPRSKATNEKELIDLIDLDMKHQVNELVKDVRLIFYTFESEDTFDDENNNPMNVDLCFLFVEDELVGVSIINHYYLVDLDKSSYTWEEIAEYLDTYARIGEIEFYPQSILSYAHIIYDEEDYHAINVYSSDEDDQLFVENWIFKDKFFQNSYYYDENFSSFIDINLLSMIYWMAPEFYEEIEPSSDLGQLDYSIIEDNFANSAMELAFAGYQKGINTFDFVDLYKYTQGSTKEEVIEVFDTGIASTEFEGAEGAEVLSYNYQKADEAANLNFYFVDNQLVFIGIEAVDVDFGKSKNIDNHEFSSIPLETVDALFEEIQLPIMSFGSIFYDGYHLENMVTPIKGSDAELEGHLITIGGELMQTSIVDVDSYPGENSHDRILRENVDYVESNYSPNS